MTERALLVCAGGGIGDSLIASVCARALRTRFSAVDALTLPGHADALRHVPEIEKVFADDGVPLPEIAEPLRAVGYAAAVVTWATQRTARIAYAARIPVRVGQARRMYSFLFTHRVTVRSELGDVTTHWSQILLDYPRAIGCDTGDARPVFAVTEADRAEAAAVLAARGIDAARGYSIVHPTCSIAPKRPHWPLEGWVELVRALQARDPRPVLVSGAPPDVPIAERLCAATGAVSIAGATSIGGFAAVAEGAAYFIVMHSGPMHVAAATGTPTVGIFPLQADFPDRWAPLGKRAAAVRASYACRPGERMETCPDYACVKHLAVPRVLATLDGLLERGGERS